MALHKALLATDGSSRPRALLAWHLAQAGGTEEARALLSAMQATARQRFVPPTALATVHAALGDTGAALDALESAHAGQGRAPDLSQGRPELASAAGPAALCRADEATRAGSLWPSHGFQAQRLGRQLQVVAGRDVDCLVP